MQRPRSSSNCSYTSAIFFAFWSLLSILMFFLIFVATVFLVQGLGLGSP